MHPTFQPSYHSQFHCTAADCPFNCCKEWKIAVDADTKKRWKSLACPEGMHSKKAHLADYVTTKGITLCEDGHCPFLREDGLCNIVCSYGEEALSVTCHTFPREVHDLGTRTELTLSSCCPAVLDLLWAQKAFTVTSGSAGSLASGADVTTPSDIRMEAGDASSEQSILLALRDFCMQCMADATVTIENILKSIFYLLLDWCEADSSQRATKLQSLSENYQEVLAAVQNIPSDKAETAVEQREVFLDLIDQYRQKGIYTDFLEPLAECAEAVDDADDFHRNASKKSPATDADSFEILYKSWEPKLRLLLTEEIYSTMFLSESDLYSMTMKWQWLAMVYAGIKQALYFSWQVDGCPSQLPYETFRDCIMFMMRITGYSEADIEEYLSECFEEVIWQWGYMSLLLG